MKWQTLCALVLVPVIAQGQPTSTLPRTKAQIRLTDASLVNVVVLQEAIEVMTEYGKLRVPVSEVRRIQMALRCPPGVADQVQQAIRDLGDSNYKKRLEAAKVLLEFGPYSHRLLQPSLQSLDLEVKRRAHEVVAKLESTLEKEEIEHATEDMVVTHKLTDIKGGVISPTLKIKSTHFGDFDLPFSEIRRLTVLNMLGTSEIVMDAAKYGSAPIQWKDTKLQIDRSLRLTIRSSGKIDLYPQTPGQYLASPAGYNTSMLGVGGKYKAGLLLGKIGKGGQEFPIGDSLNLRPNNEGALFLHIVPSPWNCPSIGQYEVKIRTSLATD